jgi:hypothetical protein
MAKTERTYEAQTIRQKNRIASHFESENGALEAELLILTVATLRILPCRADWIFWCFD